MSDDPRIAAIPDVHGHAKGEHKPYAEERPIALSARMLFLWFFHACRRGAPRFLMVADHMNYLTFEDPAAVNLVRRALKLAQAGDLYGAAETAGVDVGHAAVVSEGLRKGMRFSIGAEVDNDPRSRPDAQNIVDAMRPDGMIRSVHFLTIEHPVHGPNWNWPFDNPEFSSLYDHVGTEKTWELYMAALLDAIERLPGNIIGHFYVPANFGHWPDAATLEKYEDQMLDAAHARGMAVEFNTRFLYRDHPPELQEKYRAANLRLLKKAKQRGVGIAIGSDAHSPRDQGGAFDEVLAMLDAAEINELVFPLGGRLAQVALRATKEHLEKRAAATVPAVAGSSISGFSRAELGIEARPETKPVSKAAAAAAARAAAAKAAPAKPAAAAKAPAKATAPAKAAAEKPVAVKAASAKAVAAKAPAPVKAAAAKAPPAKAKAPEKAVRKVAAPAKPKAAKAPARKPAAKAKAAPAKPAAKKKLTSKPAARTAAKKAVKAKPAAKAPARKAVAKSKAKPAAAPAKKTAAKKAPAKKSASKRSR
jgi:HisJ family histidinol phosphate phosphatase